MASKALQQAAVGYAPQRRALARMELVQSKSESDWEHASKMLFRVVEWLDSKKVGLWSGKQVAMESLRQDYKLDQLFWLRHELQVVGLVFLMNSDPFFWPEAGAESSLYFHKLAIHPDHSNKGFGKMALDRIQEYAISKGHEWIRLDCDDREPLHRFYSRSGYQLVDVVRMEEYRVARYQLRTGAFDTQPSAVGATKAQPLIEA